MTKTLSVLLSVPLISGIALAQNSSPQHATRLAQTQVRFAPGTEIRAQLDKTIDAKKAKPGEIVEAKTLDEIKSGTQVIAPRGSKITGHVVAANPHEKQIPSRLEIAFDKLDLGNGTQTPLPATIQALAKPENNFPAGPDNMGSTGGGAGPMGGNSRGIQPGGIGQPGALPGGGDMGNTTGASQPAQPGGALAPNSQGVEGISGVSLSSGPSHDSVLTSDKHNVKLDSGTQMVLRVQ